MTHHFRCVYCGKMFSLEDRAMTLWSDNVGLIPTRSCVWCWEELEE